MGRSFGYDVKRIKRRDGWHEEGDREIKENWKIREERLERKIDDLEERIKMLERQEEEGKEKWEERIEEITKKVIILLEERKGKEQQGTTRQKSGVYE